VLSSSSLSTLLLWSSISHQRNNSALWSATWSLHMRAVIKENPVIRNTRRHHDHAGVDKRQSMYSGDQLAVMTRDCGWPQGLRSDTYGRAVPYDNWRPTILRKLLLRVALAVLIVEIVFDAADGSAEGMTDLFYRSVYSSPVTALSVQTTRENGPPSRVVCTGDREQTTHVDGLCWRTIVGQCFLPK